MNHGVASGDAGISTFRFLKNTSTSHPFVCELTKSEILRAGPSCVWKLQIGSLSTVAVAVPFVVPASCIHFSVIR